MKNLIAQYIESKRNAWSLTTSKSEKARMNSLFTTFGNLCSTEPATIFEGLKKLKPYSRVTTWTRLVDFYDWMIENEHAKAPNPYKRWKRENAKQFKNFYERQLPEISFEQASLLIQAISDESIRNRATILLYSGLRYFECDRITSSKVIGKGDKARQVYLPPISGPIYSGPYFRFYAELKKVGLKPHMLRKLFATELHKKGLNDFDICRVMGWSSIETAKSYIAPKKNEQLSDFIKKEIQS